VGGETQQTSLNSSTGYSDKAKGTGKPAYLEPNSNSMQKPIEGAIRVCFAETIEDRSPVLAVSSTIRMLKKFNLYIRGV
jgi:hypothetical protein